MQIPLTNTTTIFQLAFAINAVTAALMQERAQKSDQIVDSFLARLQGGNSTTIDWLDWKTRGYVKEAFHITYPGFKWVRAAFLFCIGLSLISAMISFTFLYYAANQTESTAIKTGYSIDSELFLDISAWFIFVNPIIYFLFLSGQSFVMGIIKFRIPNEPDRIIEQLISFVTAEQSDYRRRVIAVDADLMSLRSTIEKIKLHIIAHAQKYARPLTFLKGKKSSRELETFLQQARKKEQLERDADFR